MKFLLSKLNHLGDTLVMTPTIRFLRERYPDARIDVLVRSGCEVMLRNNPDITNVIAVARPEKSKRSFFEGFSEFLDAFKKVAFQRYDYAFDLSDSDRGKFWICMSLAKVRAVNVAYSSNWKHRWLFNRRTEIEWAEKHQVEKDSSLVQTVLGTEGEVGQMVFVPEAPSNLPWLDSLGSYAVIHPTSRWSFKEWLPDRWAAVADQLSKQGLRIVFSHGPDEREKAYVESIRKLCQAEHYSTDGKVSLSGLGWLTSGCELFLGVDTVAMHLAAAVQAPTVGLFGPSSEWSWHPWKTKHELVSGNCECKRPPRAFVCDQSKLLPCIESITVEDVIKAAGKLRSVNKD